MSKKDEPKNKGHPKWHWAILGITIVVIVGILVSLYQINDAQSKLKIEKVDIQNFGFEGSVLPLVPIPSDIKFDLLLTMSNPTFSPLEIEKIRYKVNINDETLLTGSQENIIISGSTPFTLHMKISLIKAGSILLSSISSNKAQIEVSGTIDVPVKLFGSIKIFTVTIPYIQKKTIVFSTGSSTSNYLDSSKTTTYTTLNIPSQSVYEGEIIKFTGRLTTTDGIGIDYEPIEIWDQKGIPDKLAIGITSSDGYFFIEWTASKVNLLTNDIDTYAKFNGDKQYANSKSIDYIMTIQPSSSTNSKNTPSSSSSSSQSQQTSSTTGKIIDTDIYWEVNGQRVTTIPLGSTVTTHVVVQASGGDVSNSRVSYSIKKDLDWSIDSILESYYKDVTLLNGQSLDITSTFKPNKKTGSYEDTTYCSNCGSKVNGYYMQITINGQDYEMKDAYPPRLTVS